ncbi:MAG: response regulator [Devosia sp.]|nr:response regulator [Devosia sp.]
MRILIVEDNRTNLMVLKGIVERMAGTSVAAFLDPLEALAATGAEIFDLVLVDFTMPRMDGRTFIERLRVQPDYRHVPVVMITGESDRQVRLDAITAGATDFLNKPIDPIELKARITNLLNLRQSQLDLADRADWLAREVGNATRHLTEREEEVIWRLSRALEYRDGGTGDHISRVATVARLIAEGMGLEQEQSRIIYLSAPLHDIGKVAIPDAILSKPGRLDDAELAVMRTHVPIGTRILSDGSSDLIRCASRIARSHHERWDGLGYPDGLSGEDIPLEGRIVAVADVFDALCTERPYKPAWPIEDARREIGRNAGSHFDPNCVAAFERRWPTIMALYEPGRVVAAA